MIKLQILQTPTKKYFGEMWVNGKLEFKGSPMTAEIIAIKNINKAIDKYNNVNGLIGKKAIQHYPEINGHLPIVIGQKQVGLKGEIIEPAPVTDPVTDPVQTKAKTQKPKRKPFTPYGLNGYLVDKQGNVRLMLDRRANASTIVLAPEMFAALSEMVRKTQEQQNA